MEKAVKMIAAVGVIAIFFAVVYQSKSDYYENEKAFYKKYFNGEVRDIQHGRGTKIYYSKTDFFYSNDSKTDFKIGDNFKKSADSLELYRNGDLIRKVKIDKPAATYFDYFFGYE